MPWHPRLRPALILLATACAGTGGAASHPLPVVDLSECGPAPGAGQIFLEPQLSTQLALRHPGPMTYPAELRARRVSGTVRIAFVIDTTGRAIPSSLRSLSADDPAFVDAARTMILGSLWSAGSIAGRPVAVCTITNLHFDPL